MVKVTRDFVFDVFNHFGYDVLLLQEWYTFLINNGVESGNLKSFAGMFEERRLLVHTLVPSVVIRDLRERLERLALHGEFGGETEGLGLNGCRLLEACIIDNYFDRDNLVDDTLIILFRDGGGVTFGDLKNFVFGAFSFFGRDFVSEVEFMKFLMERYNFNLERAYIVSAYPTLLPGVESSLVDLDSVKSSLEKLDMLGFAKRFMECFNREYTLTAFAKIE